ncbi:unknown [Clostridium sp. CAG:678]|jgi:hypothetical protein|nr:unknown [Clostridium sp. CAG:678]
MKNLSIKEFVDFCTHQGFTKYILSSENQESLIRPSFVIEFNNISGIENQNIINLKRGDGSWIQFNNVERISVDEHMGTTSFTIKYRKQSLPIWNLPLCTFVAK